MDPSSFFVQTGQKYYIPCSDRDALAIILTLNQSLPEDQLNIFNFHKICILKIIPFWALKSHSLDCPNGASTVLVSAPVFETRSEIHFSNEIR